MTTTDDTYRPTPVGFDDYLQREGAEPAGRRQCDCCGAERDCWHIPAPTNYVCEFCLRRWHTFEFHEDRAVRELLEPLDDNALRTILKLQEMTIDTKIPHLTHAIATQILVERDAAAN